MIIKIISSVLLSLIFGALCFGAGAFTALFNQNMCYSDALSELGAGAEKAASSPNPETFKAWTNFANNLPLRGYESSCKEIIKYTRAKTPHEL